LKHFRFGRRSVYLALFLLCLAAYGPFLPRLGFYWDDWPWVWLSHLKGPAGMLAIDRLHRPLAGELLWLGSLLAGTSALRWQVLNLLYRWLGAAALFWALRQVWPRQVERAAWAACLFLVYPGFKQQFVAVNSSRHLLPLALFFLSLGLMAWAARDRRRRRPLTVLGLALSLLTMLSTDYYFGLELIRPAVLWLALEQSEGGMRLRLKSTLRGWAPYLLLAGLVYTARYFYLRNNLYPLGGPGVIAAASPEGLITLGMTIVRDALLASLEAWRAVLAVPISDGRRVLAYYALLAGGVAIAMALYFLLLERRRPQPVLWRQLVGLGLCGLLLGSLPFLAAKLKMGLAFPADRTTLAMAFGASLLLTGLVDGLARRRTARVLLISALIGLGAGFHFRNGLDFYRDWIYQRDFFRQLAWRMPGIEPGTALLTVESRKLFSTDNSWTAPLNWLYAPESASGDLPLMMFYLDLRLKTKVPALDGGLPISTSYASRDFDGSTDDALVLYYDPPACLRLLHPDYDRRNPQLSRLLVQALELSDLSRVSTAPAASETALGELFGPQPEPGWCYYFEKADLARQQGDWRGVAEIGEQALLLADGPRHPAELAPFIQGYAHLGEWERAGALTLQALRQDAEMAPMLCALWGGIDQETETSPQKGEVLREIEAALGCPGR
jgi:hypothetical protein